MRWLNQSVDLTRASTRYHTTERLVGCPVVLLTQHVRGWVGGQFRCAGLPGWLPALRDLIVEGAGKVVPSNWALAWMAPVTAPIAMTSTASSPAMTRLASLSNRLGPRPRAPSSSHEETVKLGIFSKKPAAVTPVSVPVLATASNELDLDWFRVWTRHILEASGVDQADELNAAALTTKALALLQNSIRGLMEKNSGMWAWPQMHSYLVSLDATPWGALELVAGWDDRAIPLLKEELERFAAMLIPRGQADGRFRHEW